MAEQRFMLRFNRVRLRGRGWVLAGFELVTETPAADPPLATAPEAVAAPAKPSVAQDEIDDPWQNEVRRKLLD